MRRIVVIILLLLAVASVSAQEFIGCRTDSGWAETPMLRKTFTLPDSVFVHSDDQTLSFIVSVTSLGYHEVYVNHTRVCDYVMQPAVSQLDKRAPRVNYDIRDLVHHGENLIEIFLGQGWGRIYGIPAAVMAEGSLTVSDEHFAIGLVSIDSDTTWEASPSPYSYTDSWQPMQFGGERYDARIREAWRPAAVYDAKDISISKQEFEGNRIVDTLDPVEQTLLPDGSTLLDFGRVITGWFYAMYGSMKSGQEVTMEYLDHRDAKPPFTETDIFISDGAPSYNIFRNRFHMHAFRYVRVKGAGVGHARALQISAVDPYGGATFECSDPRLNAIHDMVKYTLSCLTFSGYMVDCPHIERMGYGGDGNNSTNTLQTLWDVRSTYANWMQAWADAMQPDGELPYVAPAFRTGGGPYWSGFIIKAPWRTYLNYGDRTLIFRHYDRMWKWLEFVERHCDEDGILQPWPDNERHAWFLGDWAVPEGVDKGGESVLHASSCFISDCLADMIKIDSLENFSFFRQKLSERRQRLNEAIHRRFYHPETHTYANGTPLDQCYALLMGIPPDSATAAAVKAQLLKDCHGKYRDHIAAGLMGVPVFTEWCIREKETNLMATILRQPDYPGYLNMMNQGATTTWESWDCGRPGKEDRSRVHNCYNGIGIWFYQALAGIRPNPEQPGYKHFFVDPQPCEGVDWVRCTKPTQYGDIRVEIENGKLKVEIPVGTTATLYPGTPSERTVEAGNWEFSIK